MRKHKNKIIAGVIISIILTFVFWYGGDAPGLRGWVPAPRINENAEDALTILSAETETMPPETVPNDPIPSKEETENAPQNTENAPIIPAPKETSAEGNTSEKNIAGVSGGSGAYAETGGMMTEKAPGKDKYMTEPVPEGKPLPVEPENISITDTVRTCTLSVRCDTVLQNLTWLDKEKVDFIPQNGIIYEEKTVSFYEGESVFNLLLREMKRSKIHMEFANVPMYNSVYIEGISNLYEFDCGELSGWMYKVNGWFPNYGCSRYQLCDGDKVEWVYTCNLGVDVGGYYAAKGET